MRSSHLFGFGPSDRPPSRTFRILAMTTAVTTYLLIVVGGVVRVSGSGLGCGNAGGRNDWPFCQGGLLPPLQREAVIEFSHRWLAAIVSTLAVALLAVAWGRYRHLRAVAWTSTFFTVFLVAQVILGAVTVYNLLPPDIVMAHLANAELLLGCSVLLVILGFNGGRIRRGTSDGGSTELRTAVRWMTAAAAGTYLLVVSGAFVVAQGAGFACAGWPLCGNGVQLDSGQMATYNLGHRVVAGLVALLLAVAVMRTVRAVRALGRSGAVSSRSAQVIRAAGIMVGVMLLAQIVAGAVLVESRLPAVARSVHEALASGLWASVILLTLLIRPELLAGVVAPVAAERDLHVESGRAAPRPVAAGTAS